MDDSVVNDNFVRMSRWNQAGWKSSGVRFVILYINLLEDAKKQSIVRLVPQLVTVKKGPVLPESPKTRIW